MACGVQISCEAETAIVVVGVALFLLVFVVKEVAAYRLPARHWLNRTLNPPIDRRGSGGTGDGGGWGSSGGGDWGSDCGGGGGD